MSWLSDTLHLQQNVTLETFTEGLWNSTSLQCEAERGYGQAEACKAQTRNSKGRLSPGEVILFLFFYY